MKASEILWALNNSLFQSVVTAAISVLLGYFGSLGIVGTKDKFQKILKLLVVVPVFLPALFSVMIGLSLLNPFPMGSWGVIFILSLIYSGFAASILSEEVTLQMGQLGFVSEVYGFSKLTFHRKVLWPSLRKPALFVFAVIFVNAMTSFTIPLLVGGGKGTNLEVLIYEKIFIEQNWNAAFQMAVLQIALIGFLTLLLQHKKDQTISQFKNSRLLSSHIGLAGILVYLITYFSGYFKLALNTIHINYFAEIFNSDFYISIFHSTLFFIITIGVFFILFCGVLFLKFHFRSLRFLNFLLNPSSIIVGFTFYLLMPHNDLFFDLIKLTLVFAVVVFVSFMKSTLEGQMQLFDRQIKVARSFGISFFNFLFQIYFPQIKKRLHYATSLLFIFGISEFGLVKASGAEVKTLGVQMASYLSSYRVEGAFVISLIILFVWIIATLVSGALLGIYKKS